MGPEATPYYDPYSYEIDRDPYPAYRLLRDHAPAYYNEKLDFWALSRFDDVQAASLDWQTWSNARSTVLELMDGPVGGEIMLFMDPPRQTRVRKLVGKAFTPARVSRLEPQIRSIAVGYLDAVRDAERCDIVRDFTAKLPMDVISALLGIPPEDRDAVRGWSTAILHREPGDPKPPPSAIQASAQAVAYFDEALAERRRRPREDMMTALAEAEIVGEDGERAHLSDEQIHSFFMLLATAGNETVTKLLATAIYWLCEYPEQRKLLLEDPGRIPNAVEETLRFDPPSHYQGRTLMRDVELHGRTLPKGARVALLTGSTGRDERRFDDPDRYDVGRRVDQHLAFGAGRHFCLGASLARLESRIALEEFLRRIPDYAIPEDGIERVHTSNVRGFAGLALEYPARQ